MLINLNKDKFAAIEGAFKMLLENPDSSSPKDVIRENLENQFKGMKFDVSVVTVVDGQNNFIMAVYPNTNSVDAIVSAIMSDKPENAVETIWKKNTDWTIEIDSLIINNKNFDEKELTALLLHEIGHVVYSNSITTRLATILKYEIISAKYSNKAMLGSRVFRKIFALPIFDACVSDKKRTNIKEEIQADNFAKRMGYTKYLISALGKVNSMCSKNSSLNDSIKKLGQFSVKTLDDIKERRQKLIRETLGSIRESCSSPYMKNVMNTLYETYCDEEGFGGRKTDFLYGLANRLERDSVFNEFFSPGIKNLKRIDPTELDFVAVQVGNIKYEGDKTMLLTYIHSKLDTIDYYLQILNNPEYSKKYNVPHSREALEDMRKTLQGYRESILRYKIPQMGIININWPEGYEG